MAAPALPAKLRKELEKLRDSVQASTVKVRGLRADAVNDGGLEGVVQDLAPVGDDLERALAGLLALVPARARNPGRAVECLRCGAEVAADALGAHVAERHLPAGLLQLNSFDVALKEPDVLAKLRSARPGLAAAIAAGNGAALLQRLEDEVLPEASGNEDLEKIAAAFGTSRTKNAPGELQRLGVLAVCAFLRREDVGLEVLAEQATSPASHGTLSRTALGRVLQEALPNVGAQERRGVYYVTLFGWLLVSKPRRGLLYAAFKVEVFAQKQVRLGQLMGPTAVDAGHGETPRIGVQTLLERLSAPFVEQPLREPAGALAALADAPGSPARKRGRRDAEAATPKLPAEGWREDAVDILGEYPAIPAGSSASTQRTLRVRGVCGEEVAEGASQSLPMGTGTQQPALLQLPAARQAGKDAAWTRALQGLKVDKVEVAAAGLRQLADDISAGDLQIAALLSVFDRAGLEFLALRTWYVLADGTPQNIDAVVLEVATGRRFLFDVELSAPGRWARGEHLLRKRRRCKDRREELKQLIAAGRDVPALLRGPHDFLIAHVLGKSKVVLDVATEAVLDRTPARRVGELPGVLVA